MLARTAAVLLVAAVPLAFSGCLASVDGLGLADVLCEGESKQSVGTGETVVHPQAEALGLGENPSVTVGVRRGQLVAAQATWSSGMGLVDVEYDGPGGDAQVTTPGTWQSVALEAPEDGNVTLAIVGDPFSTGVTYTLQLTVTGCPSP